jgi:hypothetical protein
MSTVGDVSQYWFATGVTAALEPRLRLGGSFQTLRSYPTTNLPECDGTISYKHLIGPFGRDSRGALNRCVPE